MPIEKMSASHTSLKCSKQFNNINVCILMSQILFTMCRISLITYSGHLEEVVVKEGSTVFTFYI